MCLDTPPRNPHVRQGKHVWVRRFYEIISHTGIYHVIYVVQRRSPELRTDVRCQQCADVDERNFREFHEY